MILSPEYRAADRRPVASRRAFAAGLALLPLAGCAARLAPAGSAALPRVGGVERLDPALDTILDATAPVEVISTGYTWAEGPAWIADGGYLLFNDPPRNVMYRYAPGGKVEVFMAPSGLAGPVPPAIHEAGANGMALDPEGALIIADSGTRAIARIDLATRRKTILVDRFEGKRFNSPNDVTVSRSGAIYFTDPPYGLTDNDRSPLRELDFNGLYRLDPSGELRLLDRYHRPNGLALSPDERTLYLALSDEARPEILAYDLDAGGLPTGDPRRFLDMRAGLAAGRPGLPDGMDIDRSGNLFATGPGGVHICTPEGRLLGIVATGKAVANCAVGDGGRTLYMTSHDMLARVSLRG